MLRGGEGVGWQYERQVATWSSTNSTPAQQAYIWSQCWKKVQSMRWRRPIPIQGSDVLKIPTLFSCTCYDVNRDLDAIVKLRKIQRLGINCIDDWVDAEEEETVREGKMSYSHVEFHYLYLSKQISDSHVARKFSQWDDEDRCQGLVWEGLELGGVCGLLTG